MSAARVPDFFIVGAPKSGTTSLYSYLLQHPHVFMPETKEPHFFYNRRNPSEPVLGEKDLSEYLRLFREISENVLAGEASTSYLYSPTAASEIKSLRRDANIMMVLRNPVERAYSQYWNQVRDGGESLTFEAALEAEPERVRQRWWVGFYYAGCGRYAEQLRRYLETFEREAVRVYLFEDLTRNAEAVCRDAFAFLGVDHHQPVETTKVYNPGGSPKSKLVSQLLSAEKVKGPVVRLMPPTWKRNVGAWLRVKTTKSVPEMAPETRYKLKEVFREEILRLEDMIERDLQGWLT